MQFLAHSRNVYVVCVVTVEVILVKAESTGSAVWEESVAGFVFSILVLTRVEARFRFQMLTRESFMNSYCWNEEMVRRGQGVIGTN